MKPEPLATDTTPAVALHDRAADNLRYIRSTMESSRAFTSVSGKAGMTMGAIAVAASVLGGAPGSQRWWWSWLVTAVLGTMLGLVGALQKSRRQGLSLDRDVSRRFFLALTPAIAAGAVLTVALERAGAHDLIPGVWLLLYGVAVAGAGTHSVRIVPSMGFGFMVLGSATLAWERSAPGRFGAPLGNRRSRARIRRATSGLRLGDHDSVRRVS